MAQGSEEFVAEVAALNQGTAIQDETNVEMQRLSGASASHPASGPQLNFDPLLPVEDFYGSAEVAVRLPVESTNAGSSTVSKPAKVNTVAIADPFAKASLQIASPARAQGRFFTPLHMSLTSTFKVLMERGHLKPLNPQPLPNPLPARHNPSKYCVYHQQRGHGTDGCYRLRHEIQNLIDNRTIVPPQNPKDQVPHPHLNLSRTLPPTYNPSIYASTHIFKPEVLIPESMGLSTMDALEPQSSQTREPTTSELGSMIEDLQKTVADLTFGVLAPSPTTLPIREFMSKRSPIWGLAAFEESQTLGKVGTGGKNKIEAGIGPHEHLLLAVEALKAEGLNKGRVLAIVAKTVDDIFATHVGGSLNQGASREKGCCIRNVPFSYNSTLGRDQQTRPTPANPFSGAPSKNSQALKYQPRGQRVFHALHMPLSRAFQILVGQGHLKPLEPQPLPKRPPPSHNPADYCAFHQRAGHDTDVCFRLRHEVQDLFDNGVILPPSSTKSIGTGSVNLGDNVM